MNQLFVYVLACLMLSACASAEAQGRPKSLEDVRTPPSGDMPLPETRSDSVLGLLAALYPEFPGEGRSTFEIAIINSNAALLQATIIQTGVADDAIAATRDVLLLANDGEWHVTGFKQERKCYRTGIFDWTTHLCP